MLKKTIIILNILLFSSLATLAQAKPIKIIFWHSMAGQLGNEVKQVTKQFNKSQHQYQVVPIYKGTYTETLTSTAAAFRAGKQPNIVQIFEVGTATMMYPKGVTIPVDQLMKQSKTQYDPNDLIPVMRSYYSDTKDRLAALPFNVSAAVLYYNKDAYKKAGLDPRNPPLTWPQVKTDALKLLHAGYQCGFTTSWPSWIQLETFSAWHNLPMASEDGGFNGFKARMEFDNPTVVHQIATLAKWQKNNIFEYGGRGDNAMSLFTSQHCPMFFESSGSLANLKHELSFSLGVAPLPYWPNVKHAPQNAILGGGALWAMTGHSAEQNKGVAEFFAFLLKPKIQAEMQRETGYLPVTISGYQLSKEQGYYRKNPGAEVAINMLDNKKPSKNSHGIRLGYYPQIRDVNNQELEAAFSGLKSAKQALADAVQRDNRLLKKFAGNVS